MVFSERRVDGATKYKGVIVNVRLDKVRLWNGKEVKREVVEHPGGVTILPVDENYRVWCVSQYRYPIDRVIIEAPAGKLEPGEKPDACAARELSEETGFTADEMVYLGPACTSPGYSTETLHVFLARGLHKGEMHPDEGEFLDLVSYPLRSLVEMCMLNEIDDAKTIIAVFKAAYYLGVI